MSSDFTPEERAKLANVYQLFGKPPIPQEPPPEKVRPLEALRRSKILKREVGDLHPLEEHRRTIKLTEDEIMAEIRINLLAMQKVTRQGLGFELEGRAGSMRVYVVMCTGKYRGRRTDVFVVFEEGATAEHIRASLWCSMLPRLSSDPTFQQFEKDRKRGG